MLSLLPSFETFVYFCGLALVTSWVIRFLAFLRYRVFKQINLEKYRQPSVGESWAIVTGASEGIGRGFAVELARQGFSVVIMARTKSKLEEVAKECNKAAVKAGKTNVTVRIHLIDFMQADSKTYAQMLTPGSGPLSDISGNISILVNNIGYVMDRPMPFEDVDAAQDERMLRLNCDVQTMMTKVFLPGMKSRNRGGIINLASAAAVFSPGGFSTYTGTKCLNLGLSNAILHELQTSNIDVLAVKPNWVQSQMIKWKSAGDPTVATPQQVAVNSLAALDTCKTYYPETAGALIHQVLEFINLLPPKTFGLTQKLIGLASARFVDEGKVNEAKKKKSF